jgi:catechol 2,3-dioxygenase-like lactoylglutathione lyase family enzyme
MAASVVPPLCQVAYSVLDLGRTRDWYRDALGFVPARGAHFRGWPNTRIQGLAEADEHVAWLVDRQESSQLELFEFHRPEPRPRPADWRPCDVGYVRVGLHVTDFDAALERLAAVGTSPSTDPLGEPGQRRVCVRDPEGVLLELIEDDPLPATAASVPRPEVPVAIRSVTLSVPDLARSRRFFVEALGLQEARGIHLHAPEHEVLWGLPGARRRSLLLGAGTGLIELVQYDDPVGRSWPEGHRICDQGLLNVAFRFRRARDLRATWQRAIDAGYGSHGKPLNVGVVVVVYLTDDQGFSVELVLCRRIYERFLGFRP